MKAVALLAASVAVLAGGVAPALAAGPLTVSTSVSNRYLYFADPVLAHVTVIVDRRDADPASVRVTQDFGDWEQLFLTGTTSTSAGPYTRRTWTYQIACLQPTCLPGLSPVSLHLAPVTVKAKLVSGSTLTVRHPWPKLSVAPRFGPAPRGAIPVFSLNSDLPRATYRVAPSGLALGLDLGAALLAGLGVWIVVREVLRRRPARPAHELPPLARALNLLREAKVRPADDRRRAAGLLARTLATDRDDDLSVTASRVAWGAPEPAPARLEELAQTVEAAHGDGS
jgi:hypothetical protein